MKKIIPIVLLVGAYFAFKFAKKYIPAVKNQIEKEMAKLKESFHNKFSEARKGTSIACLPDSGLSE
jgi:hypothetical protein